jgi:hypothetical protein
VGGTGTRFDGREECMPHALPLKPGVYEKRAQQACPWIELRRTNQAPADFRD